MSGKTPLQNTLGQLNQEPVKPSVGFKVDLREIASIIEVVSVVPSGIPKGFWDSVKIYKSGATQRLYVYANGVGWLYTALT